LRWQKRGSAGVVDYMRSYPLIQSSTSRTEQDFDRFVERHAPRCDALYQADDHGLPGDTVRVSLGETPFAEDVAERRRTVEFMALGADGRWKAVGRIRHSTKTLETMQGRRRQVESTFEISGPGIPQGCFRWVDVETLVRSALDKLRAARLVPLPYGCYAP
jgi:hypothetical protein